MILVEFFYFLSFILGLSIIFTSYNMMAVLIAMIFIFVITGLLYIMIGVEYLGFLIFVIYVGAISILFLFVIMLLDLRSFSNLKVISEFLLLSLGVLVLASCCFYFLIKTDFSVNLENLHFFQFLFDFDIDNKSNIKSFGEVLYNYYYLQVLIVCFYFFLVIIIVLCLSFFFFY